MTDPITRLNAALEGRYSIERELGEGGMATVYLAEDLKHHRKVALKVLKPELSAIVGAERFVAEIRTTASLQHPHILPLFDSGEADKLLFYVMPHVEGESLRDRLEREHQLPVDEAVRIATNVAEALDYAHRHGVIHRDIKPANILMQAGKPVISDFGIALAVSAGGAGRMTETGLSLGTPHYMSPEQATGDGGVGPATDIYALGCVLYEMLVGEPPYTGSTPQAILGKIIMARPVSATEARKLVPPNVDAAIRKALEKLPADRFSGAQEFAKALADPGFRHGSVATAGLGAGPGLWNPLSMAASALAVVLGVGLAWSLLRPEPPEPPLPAMRHILSTEGWSGLGVEVGRYAAIAPDASSMILPFEDQLGLKLANSADVNPILGTEGARDVVYSPGGQQIAYAVGSEIFKLPLTGGPPISLVEDAEETGRAAMAWLDDGTLLYERNSFELVLVSENGGRPIDVMPATAGALIWMHGLPGARGALVVNTTFQAHVVNLQTRSIERVLEEVQILRAWYTPTGHLVYVHIDGSVFARPFDLATLEVGDRAFPVFNGVRTTVTRADMRLSRDGTMLYVEGSSSFGSERLVVVDLEGTQTALPLAPRDLGDLGWSPDGESVVFASDLQIYTYNVVLNTTPRQITFEGSNSRPVYSPDGTRVAFSSNRGGTDGWDLFVKDLNDDSPPRPILTLEANQFMMQWPTDTLIVFERGASDNRDLWMLDLSDPANPEARPYLASEADLERIVVSPDGGLAAYRSDESGTDEIYIRSFPNAGERMLVSRGGGLIPFWSPDGGTLYYKAGPGRPFMAARLQREPVPAVLSLDTLFTSPTVTTQSLPGSALHPDGDRFILAVTGGDPEAAGDATAPMRLILVQSFFEELKRLVPN